MENNGEGLGYVRVRGGKASIDWSRKTSSLIANGLILEQFQAFLEERWGGRPGDHILDLGAGLVPYAAVYGSYFAQRTTVDVPYRVTTSAISTSSRAPMSCRSPTGR